MINFCWENLIWLALISPQNTLYKSVKIKLKKIRKKIQKMENLIFLVYLKISIKKKKENLINLNENENKK